MLIQFHLLQNYGPANLNRDDTGSPKDALFGGYRRGRISSQCLKRSIRRSAAFKEAFENDGLLGVRTKALPSLLEKELVALKARPEVVQAIVRRVPEIIKGSTKERSESQETDGEDIGDEEARGEEGEVETRQLVFLDRKELYPLAEKLLACFHKIGAAKWEKTKTVEIMRALGASLPRSVDIAMFGRMTTSPVFQDVPAAVQVAHALSTNTLTQEFDYYTAVDDLSGEAGAGMIGDVEFNSCTYYKYLNVHWEQLVQNLGGDVDVARRGVTALLTAAAMAQPSGKQNSFAAFSLPDLVLVEVSKENLPVSYANAFVTPARPSGGQSLVEVSVKMLETYMGKVLDCYGVNASRGFLATGDWTLPQAQSLPTLKELSAWLAKQLPEA